MLLPPRFNRGPYLWSDRRIERRAVLIPVWLDYRQRAEAAEQRSKPQPTQSEPQPGSMEWFEAQKKKG